MKKKLWNVWFFPTMDWSWRTSWNVGFVSQGVKFFFSEWFQIMENKTIMTWCKRTNCTVISDEYFIRYWIINVWVSFRSDWKVSRNICEYFDKNQFRMEWPLRKIMLAFKVMVWYLKSMIHEYFSATEVNQPWRSNNSISSDKYKYCHKWKFYVKILQNLNLFERFPENQLKLVSIKIYIRLNRRTKKFIERCRHHWNILIITQKSSNSLASWRLIPIRNYWSCLCYFTQLLFSWCSLILVASFSPCHFYILHRSNKLYAFYLPSLLT